MKKLIGIVLLLTVTSCYIFKENGIDIEIVNNSNSKITKVKFSTSERLEFIYVDKIEPNETTSNFLSMRDNQSDGSYSLEFIRENGKKEGIGAGYYTNGGSLNS